MSTVWDYKKALCFYVRGLVGCVFFQHKFGCVVTDEGVKQSIASLTLSVAVTAVRA